LDRSKQGLSKQSWLERAGPTRVSRGPKNSIPNNHMKAHNHLYSYSVLKYIKLINKSLEKKKGPGAHSGKAGKGGLWSRPA
jgi:hypothetical protein